MTPRECRLRPRSRPKAERLEARELLSVAGTIDPTYGANGLNTVPVITPTQDTSRPVTAQETASAAGPGGQVDVAGVLFQGGQEYLTLVQIRPDGTRDPNFGYFGQATVATPGFQANAAFVLPDGKILLAGGVAGNTVVNEASLASFGTVRFNANGSLDATYGTGGFALNPATKPNGKTPLVARLAQATIQPDGKVVLAGVAKVVPAGVFDPTGSGSYGPFVARVNVDGTPDATFGTGGEVFVPHVMLNNFSTTEEATSGLALQPGGQIIVLGSVEDGFQPGRGSFQIPHVDGFAIRLGANGTYDPSFGGVTTQASGVVFLPNPSNVANGAAVVQPGGQILVAGTTLTHLNADGTPDAAFGPGGVSFYHLQFGVTQAIAQPDGKIVLLGVAPNPNGTSDPSGIEAAFRLNADLTPDPSFGNTATPGLGLDKVSGVGYVATSAALLSDGNIFVSGTRTGQPAPILSFAGARLLTRGTPGPGDPSQAAGALDPSYGVAGLASEPVAAGTQLPASAGYLPYSAAAVDAAARPSDGKLVVAGSVFDTTASSLTSSNQAFATLAQFNLDGTIDASFGGGGREFFAGYDAAAVAIQPDGKILLAVNPATGFGGTTNLAGVYRLFPNGLIDNLFHFVADDQNNGFAPIPGTTASNFRIAKVTVQPDGKIVVAGSGAAPTGGDGFAFARLNADGSPDTTFGASAGAGLSAPGFEFVPFTINRATIDRVAGVALQPDGKIVAVGSAANGTFGPRLGAAPSVPYFDAVALRLNADGSLDATFGGAAAAGKVILPIAPAVNPPGGTDAAGAVALQPGGQVLVLVDATGVVRLKPDGTVDAGFGFGGTIFTAPSTSLLVQPDGKIVTAGALNASASTYFKGIPAVSRFTADGSIDATFGSPSTPGVSTLPLAQFGVVAAALEFDGNILLAGNVPDPSFNNPMVNAFAATRALGQASHITPPPASPPPPVSPPPVSPPPVSPPPVSPPPVSPPPVSPPPVSPPPVSPPPPPARPQPPADFDGSGRSNLTVYLTSIGAFASRPTNGGPDVITPFGIPGAGQTIPAPGDYDGSGRTEFAAYLPATGVYAYRPAGGGPDVLVPFGLPGAGRTIPTPGDYQGLGKDNLAVYLPVIGSFAIRPFGGAPDLVIPFGVAGPGQSIPAVADYFGTGRSDIAVYLPSIGAFAIRPPGGGPDQIIPFGVAGAGQSIPVPGDYDGSGRAELAVYVPSLGVFAYRPANGGPDVVVAFGTANDGTVPVPGDYTGVGHAELAVYDPTYGTFAYRPGRGGADVIARFGEAGAGRSLAVAAPELSFLPPVASSSSVSALAAGPVATVQAASVAVATPKGPAALASRRPGRPPVTQPDPARKPG